MDDIVDDDAARETPEYNGLTHWSMFAQREDTTRAFYQMCAEMKRMANAAPPTEFHQLMKDLDDANKLFRIYTQVRCTFILSTTQFKLTHPAFMSIEHRLPRSQGWTLVRPRRVAGA